MKHLLVLLVTCTVATFGRDHTSTYKSFEDAVRECADYYQLRESCIQRFLADPESSNEIDPRLSRCVLLNLVAWDDSTGVRESVLRQFFEPASCCDRDYRRRTAQCAQEEFAKFPHDANNRACEALRCYLRNYGTLIRHEKKFIPLTALSARQLKVDDYLISNTPQCVLAEISRGDFGRDDELAKLYFVGTIRGGFLDDFDKRKVSVDKLYTQFGHPDLLSPHAARCLDDVVREFGPSGDAVQTLYQQYKRCFKQYTNIPELQQKVAVLLLENGTSYAHTTSYSSNRCSSNSCGCRPDHRYSYPSNTY